MSDSAAHARTVAASREVCLWLTPKIFASLRHPTEAAEAFFDHYAGWAGRGDRLTLNFCAGNGDHILAYRGSDAWDDTFDWARYNCYAGEDVGHHTHNHAWLSRVREGGERSHNPYSAGPMFLLSDETLDYRTLAGIYAALRGAAADRGIDLTLLEYLEPGPEFCRSEWKTHLHPEGARGQADAGGNIAQGVIDVTSTLTADSRAYAAFPHGITEGLITGDFVAAQSAAFVRDFGLDGIFLGNQFGLLGFWDPAHAPEPTLERRTGITRFFVQMREHMAEKLIYWMDSYWPADVEDRAWAMSRENYYLLDAIMVCNFAVLVERTQMAPNLLSRFGLRGRDIAGRGAPRVLFSFDFVDPWYWYRTYLDDRRTFLFQHEVYADLGHRAEGVTFFANDTFGHFVWPDALERTRAVILDAASEPPAA
ncbi:hypothetical protein [Microbacterium xanthum]|uniref:hypothetical protein n=1 Tax=Microbacterium xanthum TaxID=3079794 RepID=UPI002AD34F85|nr:MULTISPECIES: hypothetical protein [unclassified Microbacterium]MDZ8171525.1 hypothetical protein [Microbacterium sp. KSW-48]MDZ8200436.1 hypothetical protein [Microbacterium sp. SSW1-59]